MIKLIAGLWSGILSLIAALFAIASRKVTVVTAGLTAFTALTVAFVASINALVGSLASAISAAQSGVLPLFLGFVGQFMPSNFAVIVGAVVSAKICRAAYDLGRKKTDILVYGN